MVEARKRKLAIVKGSTAADMVATALFYANHVRAELLRLYYAAKSSGDRLSETWHGMVLLDPNQTRHCIGSRLGF